MKKYIVEAPEPKNGQIASSGGIRENGKLQAHYRDPIPYDESPQTDPTTSTTEYIQMMREYQNSILLMEVKSLIWQELLLPYTQSALRYIRPKISSALRNKLEGSATVAQTKEVRTAPNSNCSPCPDNIVPFPQDERAKVPITC